MKNKYINIIMCLVLCLLHLSVFGQSKNSYSKFSGTWINTQFEDYLNSSNESIKEAITPHYLSIDSNGLLTLFLRLEQKSVIGKPIKEASYGKTKRLIYEKNYQIYITEISNEENIIVLGFSNNPSNILFRKK